MSRIAYVNGRYRPWRDATVHVEDRGYQFSDGVYEVCEVRGGRMVDERRHMARLERSLAALRIAMPMSPAALGVVMRETIRRNRVEQRHSSICRSAAAWRDATMPFRRRARRRRWWSRPARSTARATRPWPRRASPWSPCPTIAGAGSTSSRSRCLPNVLAKQAAREQGAREAWFVDQDGHVTEGLFQQCLDRDRATARWSPAPPTRRSCAASPATC